ncbi:MAG: Panacea domain-containing protein [Acidimicrobiales bacterium]
MENEAKLGELLLYVAGKVRTDPTGGATKLNKILFFSEFSAARALGRPITGVTYQKLERGPAPHRLVPVRNALIESGAAELVDDQYFGRTIHRLVPRREADLSSFDDEEVTIVDQVVDALWGKTAGEVSERSHSEMGWKMVEDGEEIPYSAAYLAPAFTPNEAAREHAARLVASQQGE